MVAESGYLQSIHAGFARLWNGRFLDWQGWFKSAIDPQTGKLRPETMPSSGGLRWNPATGKVEGGWIAVGERIPSGYAPVIAYDEFYGIRGEATFHQGKWSFVGSQKDDCSITHWQPLPEPPSAGRGTT